VKRITKWLIAALFFVTFYALIQYIDLRFFTGSEVGLDPFIWRGAFGNRIFTTFGNPNFVGNFLVIMIPIIISLYIKNSKKILYPVYLFSMLYFWMILVEYSYDGIPLQGVAAIVENLKPLKSILLTLKENAPFIIFILKVITIGIALYYIINQPNLQSMLLMFLSGLLFINLISTDTKGAYIGFTAGVVITYLIYNFFFLKNDNRLTVQEKNKLKKTFTIALSGFVAVAAIVIIGSIIIRPVSVKFRVFTWLGNWEMAQKSPWLGNGVGSFKANYPAYRRPEIIILEGRSNTETDHVENEYQEVLSDEGIPGLTAFLWMIFLSFYYGFKRISMEQVNSPVKFFTFAYLGSWIAALTHWNTDVSIRFVSSGIYTCFLPAMIFKLSQTSNNENHHTVSNVSVTILLIFWAISVMIWVIPQHHIPQSPHWPYLVFLINIIALLFISTLKKNTRKTIYTLLSAIFGLWWFYYLDIERKKMPPFPDSVEVHVVAIIFFLNLILLITELFENGIEKTYEKIELKPYMLIITIPAIFSAMLFKTAVAWFMADIAHNRAIFFSKNGIWKKLPEYEARVRGFPPDFRNMFEKVGGALEHYEVVNKLNPTFPMSYYFTGNVYNDWGAEFQRKAIDAYNAKKFDEAEKYKNEALNLWNKALESYKKLKLIMPNYVQSHHQIGIIMQRIADMFETMKIPDWQKYDLEAIRWFKM
ncbi:MAG: O-antigen ligase family protein, partial [bacterium]|nr:O-antigen ligase family protein [bacterium]